MEFLADRPMCEWPVFVPILSHPATKEHGNGKIVRKRSNDRRSSSDKTGQFTRLRQRLLILKHYGPACHICLANGVTDQRAMIDLEATWPHPACFTRDHLLPRSQGGADTPDNLRPAHHKCNRDRGDGPVIFSTYAAMGMS